MPTYTPLKRKQAVEGAINGYIIAALAGDPALVGVNIVVGQRTGTYLFPAIISSCLSDQPYIPGESLYQGRVKITLKTSLFEVPAASESQEDIDAQQVASEALHLARLDSLSNIFEEEAAILAVVNAPEDPLTDTRLYKGIHVWGVEQTGDDADRDDGHVSDEIDLLVTFSPYDMKPSELVG